MRSHLIVALISFLLGGLLVFFLLRSNSKETGSIKADKEILKQDAKKLVKLTLQDTSFVREKDSLIRLSNQQSQKIAYWQSKYQADIKPTKEQIKEVFKQDTVTIVKEVIKGRDCDSLRRYQALQIITLSEANKILDSLSYERNKRILVLTQMDSVHYKIESALNKKIKNRTLGEIALGALAVLAFIFGH